MSNFLLKIGSALGYSAEMLLVIGVKGESEYLHSHQENFAESCLFSQLLEQVRQAFVPQAFWFFGQGFHKLFGVRDSWSLCQTQGFYLRQVGDQGVICHFSPDPLKMQTCSQTKRLAWENMQRLKKKT